MRPATPEELLRWDELVLANPDGGHIYQTKTWGEFKAGHGWAPKFIIHKVDGVQIATLYLVRKFPWFGEVLWAPKGPGVSGTGQLAKLLEKADYPKQAFMLRVDPLLSASEANETALAKMGLVKAKRDGAPDKATIIVDISPSEEEILAAFKPKTRYNIRLAAKKGVTVSAVAPTQANLDQMYDMMSETAIRGSYYMRDRAYCQGYWTRQIAAGQGQLLFASYDGEVLAGVFASYFGGKGWYKDGGSRRVHANLMAPYLLQWETMRWLKNRGVVSYDMVGVPPPSQLSESHKLYGLYQFKSGFNSEITEYAGSYDLPLSSKYRQWDRYGERLVGKYHMRIRRQLLY